MTVDPVLSAIHMRLRSQVVALQASMASVEEELTQDAPRADLFDGPIVQSLLVIEDAAWLHHFLQSLSQLNAQKLMLCTLLALQRQFKDLLMTSPQLRTWFCTPLTRFEPDIADVDACIWYKAFVFSLIKSKQDKPRVISAQLKSAGLTYQDQQRLEESLYNNPELSTSLGSAASVEEWSMDVTDSNILLSHIFSPLLVKSLTKLKAPEAIACIARVPQYRGIVIQQGGVGCLLDALSHQPALSDERAEQVRVALARLCMTTDPRCWKYPQVVDLAKSCFHLITESSYELYQFEAGIGLVNLLSYSPDVQEWVGNQENCLETFLDLTTQSDDERMQQVGSELVCNVSCCEGVVEKVLEGKCTEELKVMAFLMENGAECVQLNIAGAIAILTGYTGTVPLLLPLMRNGDLLLAKVTEANVSAEMAVRIASVISNVVETEECPAEVRANLISGLRQLKSRVDKHEIEASERLADVVSSYC